MTLHTNTIQQTISYIGHDQAKAYEVARALSHRVTQVDATIGAYISFDPQRGESALPTLPKGPLYGVPVSLKDNMCTRGWETTCSSRILQGFIPPYDATVVEKLRAAGAYIFAKCDMDEFAFGSSCETSYYNGRCASPKKMKNGPVANPWNVQCVPGGSSGGSAACVAADEAICSLGSDTGGSIRQPAALCGVVGLKPTYGRVSRYGLIAFGSSLDQIGPFTKSVEDSALLLEVIAGHDPKDSTSAPVPVPCYREFLTRDIKGLRIGIPAECFQEGVEPEVKRALQEALTVYKKLGATCVDVTLPHTKYAVAVYYIIGTAEASSNLARFDGVEYGYRCDGKTLHDMYVETRNHGFGSEAKRRILLGTFVLSAGYYDAYYLKAQKVRALMAQDYANAFTSCDVIMTPTSPSVAFKIGEKLDNPLAMYLSDIFTIPANLVGVPSMSIPAGFSSSGLPVGMQLTAPLFKEEVLFRAAYAFEQSTDIHTKRPVMV